MDLSATRSSASTGALCDSVRRAGIALPLFSVRTAASWAIGEIPDLVALASWAARMGQSIIQLLPVNETSPDEASPYSPLSAFALDPLYLGLRDVEDVEPRLRVPPPALVEAIGGGKILPRAAVRDAKLSVLAGAWNAFREHHLTRRSERGRRFSAFLESQATWLNDYALFRAIKEQRAWQNWQEWPVPLRERDPEALRQACEDLAERVGFFRYVQWLIFTQWSETRQRVRRLGVKLKGDVPFVIGRDSADVWAHGELFVAGWDVGAPPDDFSATGQNWHLPLYDWPYAAASQFSWWRARVRQAAELYDLLRVDHIVGVFRTYGVPVCADQQPRFHPEAETEQREQGEAFLRMLIEASGNSIPIVEDLGTIPDFVREALRQFGIRGYAVLRWERQGGVLIDPRQYPERSVATTGTHDTSTLVGWWSEMPGDERRSVAAALNLTVDDSCFDTPMLRDGVRRALLRRVFEAASDLVILPVQDVFGWPERVNVPMTLGPGNWNYRLPFELGPQGEVPPEVERETSIIRPLVTGSGRDAPPTAGVDTRL